MLEVGRCSGCGLIKPIVNKRYNLCDDDNYKRLHNGKTKQEVYQDRFKDKAIKKKERPVQRDLGDQVKKASTLRSVSSKSRFKCSDGSVLSQAQLNFKLAQVYDQIKSEREPVCQGTGLNNFPLSFSHTISRSRCKELGKSELIYDKDNIEIEGFHEPSSKPVAAHNIWESGTIEQKVNLLNFERKLEYIAKHDPQGFTKLIIELEQAGITSTPSRHE